MAWLQFRTLEHAADVRDAQIDPKRQIFSIKRRATGETTFVVCRPDEIGQIPTSLTHMGGIAIDPIHDECVQYIDTRHKKTLFIVVKYTHKHNLQAIADIMSVIFHDAIQKALDSASTYDLHYALYPTVGYFFHSALSSAIRHKVWLAIKEKITEMALNQDAHVHALLNFELKDNVLICTTIVDDNHFPLPEEPYLQIHVPFSDCVLTNMKTLMRIDDTLAFESSVATSSSSSSEPESKKRRTCDPVPHHERADDDKDASVLQVLGAQLMQRIDKKWTERPNLVKIPHNTKNTYSARSSQTHIITSTVNFWCTIGQCYHDNASTYIILRLDSSSCSYKAKCHKCGSKFNHLIGNLVDYQPVPEDIAIKLRDYKRRSELSF